jgi:uncharacterized protein (TIGR02588 family)
MKNKGNILTATQIVISGVSLLLVLTLLGFIFYEAITGTDAPPIITVYEERILPANQQFIVEFTAKNVGGSTAKNVQIEGILMKNGKELEVSKATLDFLPAHAERQGGLIFSHDPRQYKLELQPKGYDRP